MRRRQLMAVGTARELGHGSRDALLMAQRQVRAAGRMAPAE
jgi:hypothetical protein